MKPDTQPTANSAPAPLVCVVCGRESTAPLCWRRECLKKFEDAMGKGKKP